MLPFVRTGMTEQYADEPRVFERWQPRMLEPCEAAHAVTRLLARPSRELDLESFELLVEGTATAARLTWSRVSLEVNDEMLDWSVADPLVYRAPAGARHLIAAQGRADPGSSLPFPLDVVEAALNGKKLRPQGRNVVALRGGRGLRRFRRLPLRPVVHVGGCNRAPPE